MKYEKKRELTRNKIVNSFIEVSKEKGVEGVTVSDIIKKAQINRSTFYRHYTDKIDLEEQIEDQIIGEIKAANSDLKETDNKDIESAAKKFIYRFLTVIENNQPVLEVMISENGDIRFPIKMLKFFSEMVVSTTNVFAHDMSSKDKKLFSAFNASTALGIVVFWIHNFDEYDKDYVYNFLMTREY